MHNQIVIHTLNIFKRIYENLPPLLPKETVENMEKAIEQMNSDYSLSLQELENTMISFGRIIWPYNQAFLEFYHIYESRLGNKVLFQKAGTGLRKKYELFMDSGGSFREMYSGSVADFFTPEERRELCGLLVELKKEITAHARQSVLSTEKKKYEKRIEEFSLILKEIEHHLQKLKELAEKEQEHPAFALSVREQIRGFEYGLCMLGPKLDYKAVCNAYEYYDGKRLETKWLGGY